MLLVTIPTPFIFIKQQHMNYPDNFKVQVKLVSQMMSVEQYKHITQQQRDKILIKRMNKFYLTGREIDVAEQHYKPRLQPAYYQGDTTVDDTLIVFGTDFLSNLKIKEMFTAGDPHFHFQHIDASNCILRYSSHLYARQAITNNVKKDSQTAFKIQDDNFIDLDDIPQQGSSQQSRLAVPRQWIELNPYIYRHFFKNQLVCPNLYKDYSRKLYVRYACDKQKMVGRITIEYLEELYRVCEKIWMSEAHKREQLRNAIYFKLKQFREQNELIRRKHNQQKTKDILGKGNTTFDNRQRSRQRQQKKQNKSDMISDLKDNKNYSIIMNDASEVDNNKASNKNSVEEVQIQERKQLAEMNEVIGKLQNINLNMEDHQKGDPQVQEICKQLENLNFSKIKANFIPIPYKLAQPSQVRFNCSKNNKFKYQEYIQKSEAMEMRMKKFGQIDLTEQ